MNDAVSNFVCIQAGLPQFAYGGIKLWQEDPRFQEYTQIKEAAFKELDSPGGAGEQWKKFVSWNPIPKIIVDIAKLAKRFIQIEYCGGKSYIEGDQSFSSKGKELKNLSLEGVFVTIHRNKGLHFTPSLQEILAQIPQFYYSELKEPNDPPKVYFYKTLLISPKTEISRIGSENQFDIAVTALFQQRSVSPFAFGVSV